MLEDRYRLTLSGMFDDVHIEICIVTSLLLCNSYFQGKYFNERYSIVQPILTFTAKTCYDIYAEVNHSHSFHVQLVRKVSWTVSSQELLLCGTDSSEDASLTTTILTSSPE